MPFFVAALLGGLIRIAATLAGRVLLALGFSSITYSGLSVTLDWLKAQALQSIGLLPPDVISLMAYMKVGVAINIVVSAILVRMTLNGLSAGGSISKLVKR